MSEGTKPVVYTYEERMAIQTIRESMMKKPEIVTEIMKGIGYGSAEAILVQAKQELEQAHAVVQAFVAAASVLAKKQKDESNV